MKIEYDILAADTLVHLAEAVRLHTADGWEPVGGVAVTQNLDRWTNTWAQAIVRRGTDSISTAQSDDVR
jgi:Domain of unknown function (DUF1737)